MNDLALGLYVTAAAATAVGVGLSDGPAAGLTVLGVLGIVLGFVVVAVEARR